MGASVMTISWLLLIFALGSRLQCRYIDHSERKSIQKRAVDKAHGKTAMGSEIIGKKGDVAAPPDRGAQATNNIRSAIKNQIGPVAKAAMSGIIMCVIFGVFHHFCGDIFIPPEKTKIIGDLSSSESEDETSGVKPTGDELTGDEPTGDELTGAQPTGDVLAGYESTEDDLTGDESTDEEPTRGELTEDESTGDEQTRGAPRKNKSTEDKLTRE